MMSYEYPTDEEVKKAGTMGMFLGYYIPWDGHQNATIASENGFTRRDISDEEIVERCILALINEGADILSEGVAQRAADIDVVYINGYGFPIWRGGPMHHANAMGLDKVIEKLEKYREITGNDVYKPSEMLVNLAKDGGKLGEAPQKGDRKEKLGFEFRDC